MSGTVVLHISPEAAVGGALFVQDGDYIEPDVQDRRLHLDVSHEGLCRRYSLWKPAPLLFNGGYQQMYMEHVMQAHLGAGLDFLVGCRGTHVERESH
jgi:dihydroxy-acid dehydratase